MFNFIKSLFCKEKPCDKPLLNEPVNPQITDAVTQVINKPVKKGKGKKK